jgi:hypothetical protein
MAIYSFHLIYIEDGNCNVRQNTEQLQYMLLINTEAKVTHYIYRPLKPKGKNLLNLFIINDTVRKHAKCNLEPQTWEEDL